MDKVLIAIIVIIIVCAIIYYFNYAQECFTVEPIQILVFVSKTCPHCVDYVKDRHSAVVNKFSDDSKYALNLIYADEDKDKLFEKYNVQYVPACVIIKGCQKEQLSGAVSAETIDEKICAM
jgi:protein-disulfide isomerase